METVDHTYTLATDAPDQATKFVAKLIEQSTKTWHALQPHLVKRNKLVEELAEIERQGWTEASEYMRDGDKLILVHPTPRDGSKRIREYIGSDPKRQAEARARLARAARRQQLTSKLNDLDQRLHRAQDALDQFTRALAGKRW